MSLGGGASPALATAVRNSIASGITYTVAAGNSNASAAFYSPARAKAAITVGPPPAPTTRPVTPTTAHSWACSPPGSSITVGWHTSDTATATLFGTSMAAPHAAGAAALELTSRPSASPATVSTILILR
ncbi:S8 family serine peptidase [Streptomyces azureus]|uniref:S8 family serine peptidase n=1 Tax=Streptomyces azureus TaxID=146537 RepID=UPI00099C4CEC